MSYGNETCRRDLQLYGMWRGIRVIPSTYRRNAGIDGGRSLSGRGILRGWKRLFEGRWIGRWVRWRTRGHFGLLGGERWLLVVGERGLLGMGGSLCLRYMVEARE
jgi:hypothetical protein